jgi:general secretion pathway protein D
MTKARIGKAMRRRIALAAAVVLLTSCASQQEVAPASARSGAERRQPTPQAAATPSEAEQPPAPRARQEIVERGTGVFTGTHGTPGVSRNQAGDINLQFDATDIKQFVEVVLGDILHENFVIDPAVMGTVTMRTPRPLRMNEVLPLFEQVLEMNRAALVRAGSMYRVVPLSAATRRNVTPSTIDSATAGFTTRVIPLQFISAQEMQKILESIVADPDSVQIDAVRNLVIVSGTAQEVATVQDTVDLFDVDWLRGMSVGLYPLEHVEPKTLQNELTQVLGAALGEADGVLGGIVRLVPLERLTSLLVVSSTPAALREVETWIRRLDQPGESAGRRLYVYPMQNAKATDVGEELGEIFGSSSRRRPRA